MSLDKAVSLPRPLGEDIQAWAERFSFEVEDRLRRIAAQTFRVRKNSTGLDVGPRTRLNLVEGSGMTITVADDDIDDEVDVTLAAAGGGGGEANTASNVGAGGVGVFDAKVGVDLQFRNIIAASTRLSVVLAAGPKEVALDAVEANFDIANLGGTLAHSALSGIGANDHHTQSHVLATGAALGPDHTISGAAVGEVLRASGATTAAFDVLQHADLGGVGANDHHAQSHVLAGTAGLGADHTVSGLTAGQYLRATGATTAAFQTIPVGDIPSGIDHGGLGGLGDDDHTQYVFGNGRAGGQFVFGGTGASELLRLRSTSHATKGRIFFGTVSAYDEDVDSLGIGTSTPRLKLDVAGGSVGSLTGLLTGTVAVLDNSFSAGDSVYGAVVANATGTAGWSFGQPSDVDAAVFAWDVANAHFAWQTATVERMRMDAVGLRVEPGGVSASPREALDIPNNAIIEGTLFGGKASTSTLDLDPSVATNYTGKINVGAGAGDYGSSNAIGFDFWPNGLTTGLSGQIAAVRFNSTYTQDVNGFLTFPILQVFSGRFTMQNATGVTILGTPTVFDAAPTVRNTLAVATSGFGMTVLNAQPVGDNTGGSTLSLTSFIGASFLPTVKANVTLTNAIGLEVRPKGNTGTVTTYTGVMVNDISTATNAYSMRSTGASVEMRHAGPMACGVDGAPNVFLDAAKDFATRATARTLVNGTNNNVDATDTSLLRVTGPSAGFTITGFSDGQNGKYLVVRNTTTQAMTIANENAGSSAANRITTQTGANVVLAASVSTAWFVYDVTSSRWILLGARDSTGAV